MNIFQLAASLVLNKDNFDKGLNDAEKEASGFGDKLKGGLATAGKIGAAALTATAAGAAALTKSLMSGTKEAAAYGDNIDKMSQKMGISAQAYQEWDFILQHSGSSIGSLQASMRTLNNAVVSNSKAFTQLGISQEQVASLSREDLFAEVIKGLQGMEDETQRTALANELLGRGAMELGALLNTSAEDTEAMRQQVHELGGVMSNEAVKAAAQYQDTMQNLQTAADGLKRNLMEQFLPGISTVADGLADIFSGKGNSGLAKITKGIDSVVKSLRTALPKFTKAVTQIIKGVLTALKQNLPTLLRAVTDTLVDILDLIIDSLPDLLGAVGQVIGELAGAIVANIPKILAAVGLGIMNAAGALVKSIGQLFGIIPSAAEEAAASSKAAFEKQITALDGFKQALEGINPQLADYTSLLSDEGRTLNELEAEQKETQDHITEIIALALQEHRGLREDELRDIKEYQDKLRQLQEEELGIYQSQLRAEYIKIAQDAENLSQKEVQQHIANLNEAQKKSDEFVDALHTAKLTELENLRAAGALTEEEYQAQIAETKAYYDGMKQQNSSYYDEAMALLVEKQDHLTETVSKHWEHLAEITPKEHLLQDWAERGDQALLDYKDAWENIDSINTAAWLNLVAATAANGQELSEENRKILGDMLDAWEAMPDELRENGGEDTILAIVAGMEEYFPELKMAAQNGIDDVVNFLRYKLHGGEFVKIGENISEGVAQGMQNKKSTVSSVAASVGRAALAAIQNVLDIHSPSRVFRDIIGKNIVLGLAEGLDRYGYYATDAMDKLSDSITLDAGQNEQAINDRKIGGGRSDVSTPGYAITLNIYANQLTPTQAFEEAQNAFQMQQFLGNA